MLSIGLLAPHLKEKRTRMEEGERATLNIWNTFHKVTWLEMGSDVEYSTQEAELKTTHIVEVEYSI